MNAKEEKITQSFKLAKTDIARLQRQMDVLGATQQRLMEMMDTLKAHQLKLSQKIRDIETKKPQAIEKTVKIVVDKKPAKKKAAASKKKKSARKPAKKSRK